MSIVLPPKMLNSFCKSINFTGICSIFRDLYFYSIKTWFKALWSLFFRKFACALGFATTVFHGFLPLEGDESRTLQCMLYNIQRNASSNHKLNKQIYVLNAFCPFPKAWNQSFDGIVSGFFPLPTIECFIDLDIEWIWSFPNRSKHFCVRGCRHVNSLGNAM